MSAKIIPLPARRGSTLGPVDRDPVQVYLRRLSPSSRRVMRHHLDRIAAFLSQGAANADDIPWDAVRYEHAAAARAELAADLAPATANAALSALRGVLKEAWRLGAMDSDAYRRVADVERVPGERLPAGRALEAGEVRALFRACAQDRTAAGARDAAMVAVLAGGGVRRAELVAAQSRHARVDAGELRVIGKGNRERVAQLPEGTRRALATWVRLRGDWNGPLFCPIDKSGRLHQRGMTGQAVAHILRKRAAQAGLQHLSPHDLRRTFITGLLSAGADVVTTQRLAGHQSVTTTARYDRRDAAEQRKAVELLHMPYEDVWTKTEQPAGKGTMTNAQGQGTHPNTA